MAPQLSDQLKRLIAQEASAQGYSSSEAFLRSLLESKAVSPTPESLTDEEFEQLLHELTSETELPTLPANFSREDIYADHD